MPIEVPTGLATTAMGYVGDQLSDTGTLAIIGIVVAIPLAFYVIKRLKGLFSFGGK
jgi:3-deoxy-D-manno-octulosonate 8-phosphate phosphatase KdsC-like HAD superfamily phosphatase